MNDDFIEKIAPGAFKNMLPKDVPLRIEGGPQIGVATTHEDGTVECTITDADAIAKLGFSVFIWDAT